MGKTEFSILMPLSFPKIDKGRIGLRQMYTRNSRYANFKVYQMD